MKHGEYTDPNIKRQREDYNKITNEDIFGEDDIQNSNEISQQKYQDHE